MACDDAYGTTKRMANGILSTIEGEGDRRNRDEYDT